MAGGKQSRPRILHTHEFGASRILGLEEGSRSSARMPTCRC
ncbi:hypothetical protein OESDEN_21679 [Oesophagostomum dentatum]|uniref:Uncharacterized protein n=1 Tax=Oesophagostomum dentatum TaxID=61180 RepID=A0A0B1S053_OESDE|nr:hypothetical protein OESDEN_21679 [Oesophagostomum dentatum]